MKTNCLIWFALVCWSLNVRGQTNSALSVRQWFTAPKLQLRPLTTKPTSAAKGRATSIGDGLNLQSVSPHAKTVFDARFNAQFNTNAPPPAAPGPLTASLSLEGAGRPAEMAFARHLVEEGELTRIQPPSENRFLRPIEAIFRPTPIRLGKLRVSCSILTAIKRRNPLCLLNPFFVQGSW